MSGAPGGARLAPAVLAALLFLAGLAAGHSPALAQSCCSPATTPGAAVAHPAPRAGELVIGVFAEHYALAGGKRGRQDFAYPGDRHANAQVVTVSGYWGVTERLAAGLLLPLNRRERSDVAATGDRVAREATGPGDLAVLLYARPLPRPARREWTVGAGLKLATGRSRMEDGSGELPQELQPGSGANDLLLTTVYTEALGAVGVSGTVTWRRTGTLTEIDEVPGGEEVRRQYRFGNELLYGAGAAWSPGGAWGFELAVRGRHAEADEATALSPDGVGTEGLRTLPSTGGERVWLAPALRYAAPGFGPVVSLGALVPVYENLRGSQLGSQLGLQLSIEARP